MGFALVLGASACAMGETAQELERANEFFERAAPPVFTDEQRRASIDDFVRTLGHLPVLEPGRETIEAFSAEREGDYSCSTERVSEAREYDKLVAYGAGSETLYPGAILRGDGVHEGLFTPVALPRAPARFSVSFENLEGARSATMVHPSLASFRESLASIMSQEVTGATPANLYTEVETVHSDSQLALALGVDADWLAASVGASFNFSETERRSRYLVRYFQSYYTVDLDTPGRPSDMMDAEVTRDDLLGRFDVETSPLYVSSVTYGRMVVFTFESSYSATELGAALDFVYRGGTPISGEVSVTYRDMLEESRMTAWIMGGNGEAAAEVIDGYDALLSFIREGGNYSRESPGIPIGYKLAHLGDNSPARLSFVADYEIKTCERVNQQVRILLQRIEVESAGRDPGSELELYGEISAGDERLWDRQRNQAVRVSEGSSYPPRGESALGEAIVDVTPGRGNSVWLHGDLMESDSLSPDDALGPDALELPFESGWRREVSMRMTGDYMRVNVIFSIEPI